MQNVVDSHQINDIEIKYSMEELLTFYMEQSKSLTEELAKAKADLVLAEKKSRGKRYRNQNSQRGVRVNRKESY